MGGGEEREQVDSARGLNKKPSRALTAEVTLGEVSRQHMRSVPPPTPSKHLCVTKEGTANPSPQVEHVIRVTVLLPTRRSPSPATHVEGELEQGRSLSSPSFPPC